MKQLVALLQVVCSLHAVLNIRFPPIFTDMIGTFASFFNIDIEVLFGFGCYTSHGYTVSLFLNFATSLFFAVVILALCAYELSKVDKASPDPEAAKARTKQMFEKFDKDGTGITQAIVKEIVMEGSRERARLGAPARVVTDQQIAKIFEVADSDGSGVIDFTEFYAAMNSDDADNFSLHDLVIQKVKLDLKADAMGNIFLLVFVM